MAVTGKQTFITEEGLTKLKAELEDLKLNKRKEIAERIKEAKEHGDLSENAEYTDAKDEQAFIEGRIMELEEIVRNVEIIPKNNNQNTQLVIIGSTIKIEDQGGKTLQYTIVGSSEADPSGGRISNESPIGQSFLGKKIGEDVMVTTPAGELKFTIIKIF